MKRARLRLELLDLGLVAAGAIPGALLRWRLELVAAEAVGGLRGVVGADLLANMIGCLLIGALAAQPPRRARLFLWGGIGFCGSLTTFSSWILELSQALRHGQLGPALSVLLVSLVGGLLLTAFGYELARRCLISTHRS
ncbi:MAG: CrcB family protein [Cyanobacteria bacterium]|nr:CrcB family protein [Cyanobacteriota bacterium]